MNARTAEWVVVIRCDARWRRKAAYVLDTLLMACGVRARHEAHAPAGGPWLLYAPQRQADETGGVAIAHCPGAWDTFGQGGDAVRGHRVHGLPVVWPDTSPGLPHGATDIGVDLMANAFYFLSAWSERRGGAMPGTRQLFGGSATQRLGLPQNVVDLYLDALRRAMSAACPGAALPGPRWPEGRRFAVVLSHDVDFVPEKPLDNLVQGAKTVMRHLLRERDPRDAGRASLGLWRAWREGRDPYGGLPEILAGEQALGVRSSFQVAVGHRHPNDVNYHVENPATRRRLQALCKAGQDLCLHGSFRSTEQADWYVQEAGKLARLLARPRGSRQHFLSFHYDTLFQAQETAGIQYDMSLGYPDQIGPRAGFSHPYFPYHLDEDRPYDVLQISLFLMDVTLRSYLRLRAGDAEAAIEATLQAVKQQAGCVSVVWHPIVFGGARDPGYAELYWWLVRRVRALEGAATDGREINALWREEARRYPAFADVSASAPHPEPQEH